ncbi:MAG: DNA polymerase III subunit delta [Chiayiivirga sp.]|jgi:DNA polymerase-3 subunit delta|nr:DNA polymerase III subunit delta [Chiayiivirga sp.]
MTLSPAQLEQRLVRDALPPVVLLASGEPLLLLEAGDAVRRRAREAGYAERTVFDVDAGFDWSELGSGLASLSLFASRRLIELRLPTGRPGKEGGEMLAAMARQPAPDVVLLIQAAQWSRAHETAWVKAIDQAGWFVPMWPVKPAELPAWIGRRLAARGLGADAGAVALLAERVEGNLLAAAQEIDKLALLHPGARFDAAALRALVADSARHDVFGLTEAALAGDATHALRILDGLRGEGVQVPALLPWVASQVGILARLAGVQARGGNLAAAMQAAGLWQSKEQSFRRALARGSATDFARLLAACGRLDRLSKGRETGDPWREMERLIAGIAAPGALPA